MYIYILGRSVNIFFEIHYQLVPKIYEMVSETKFQINQQISSSSTLVSKYAKFAENDVNFQISVIFLIYDFLVPLPRKSWKNI